MRKLLGVFAAAALAVGWLIGVPTTARADDHPSWNIPSYASVVTVDANGLASVQTTIAFDFGDDPGHGVYLYFPEQQAIGGDSDHWRAIDYSLGEVTSPSGADTTVETSHTDGNLVLKVGSENRTNTGVQTYVVNYTAHGLIATKQKDSGLDEVNWQVIGGGWAVPIRAVSVKLSGPVDVSRTACFYDDASQCTSASSGTSATFSAADVGDGRGVQVVAGFPAGTFPESANARQTKRVWLGNMFPVTPATGGVAAALSALGLGWLFRRTRRSGRDQVYLGLTPGSTPGAGQEASIGTDTTKAPVTVQFTPPKDARPGELGTLLDATADDRDITATLVDLAVRGHLTIAQADKHDFSFTRLAGGDELADYESNLLASLFRGGNQVATADLRDASYADLLTNARSDLYTRVSTELTWFTANPSTTRLLAVVGGVALVVLGAALGFALGLVGWGFVGLAGVIVGVAVILARNAFGARTADGSAMLAQTKGFELYLTTAEADQIKFEEGIDVFSRYLPYAMVFGVADRWTKVFEQLAAQGSYTFPTYWYAGYGYGYGSLGGLGDLSSSMSSLTNSISSSLQAATAANSATSGGSGFSGGGGFGGGGGGGW